MLYILVSVVCYGQVDKLDFERRLNAAKNDSARAEVYRDALRHYARHNIDSLKYYSDKGIAYFRQRNYRLGEAHIIDQLSIIDQNQGRMDIARQRTQYALSIYRDLNYKPGIATTIGNLGALEAGVGNYENAIKYLIESLKLEETLGNTDVALTGYMNIATIYMQTGDTANSGKYLKIASDMAGKMPLSDKILGLYNMIGVQYAMTGQNEKAIECFLRNLELSDHPSFITAHVESLTYIGQYYLENGQPDKALSYLKEALAMARKNNIPELAANTLQEMAVIIKENDPATAAGLLNEALAIALQMGNKTFMATVYEHQVDVYKRLGKYKEALEASQMRTQVTDSLFATNKTSEINGLLATYELERSNSKVKDLEVKHMKRTAQRNLYLGILLGVGVLFIILFIFTRRSVMLNRKLRAQEAALQQLNGMKDKLFSIIAHDLRGPVARIPVILDIYEDPETPDDEKQFLLDNMRAHTKELIEMLEKLLLWGQSLVKGIMLQKETVNVSTYVMQDLALKKLALEEKDIAIVNKVAGDLNVQADATHFDFIVRNLITNAVKYTHDGGKVEIAADTHIRPGYVVLSVKDNGTGITPDMLTRIFTPVNSTPGTNNEKGTGIGLMLCNEFAILNGGEMWVESTEGKGATFFLALRQA
ncbi:hypothetical protein GCM10023093_09200 [Nemorincola caseinilytica]|uniref:histidine kinase n=1 Tax=Nemorincola caseinilytica TaxID=2054315 RepID=A0ABP8N906_9BACT